MGGLGTSFAPEQGQMPSKSRNRMHVLEKASCCQCLGGMVGMVLCAKSAVVQPVGRQQVDSSPLIGSLKRLYLLEFQTVTLSAKVSNWDCLVKHPLFNLVVAFKLLYSVSFWAETVVSPLFTCYVLSGHMVAVSNVTEGRKSREKRDLCLSFLIQNCDP